MSETNPKILQFLEKNSVGILATASADAVPHAATIYFVVDPDYSLYFMSKEQTAKSKNMLHNPQVALAVFDAKSQTTVQVTGSVEPITDSDAGQRIFTRIQAVTNATSDGSLPPISKLNAGNYVFYRLKPTTLRMAEFVKAEHPPVDQMFDIVALPDDTL